MDIGIRAKEKVDMFNLGIAAIIALVICGTLVLIATPTLLIINRKIARCTQSVPGTFVRENKHGRRSSTYYLPVVSYTLDGVEYEVETTYAEGIGGLSGSPVGSPLTVYYDPADPTYVWASKSGTFGQRTAMKILLWVGIAGCALSGFYLLFLYLTH